MYRSRKTAKTYNPQQTKKQLVSNQVDCPFCPPLNEVVVEETAHNHSMHNKYSYQYWEFMHVLDHLMIVPRRHVERLSELTDEEKIDTINVIAKYEDLGYNVYARESTSAVKSVPHQHTHLIKTANRKARIYLYLSRPYLIWRR